MGRPRYTYHAWRWKSWGSTQTSTHEGGTISTDLASASLGLSY